MSNIHENEIDLRDLFKIIWDKKFFILIFTFLVTFMSLVYVFFKNPVPLYQGTLLVEIGFVQSKEFGERFMDNANSLSKIVSTKFNITATPVRKTTNLINISSTSTNKEDILKDIMNVLDFIKNRHEKKSKFYQNTIKTKKIGNIVINNTPINKPKKTLIVVVSFVTAFIMSIFIVFFMNFISVIKEEK